MRFLLIGNLTPAIASSSSQANSEKIDRFCLGCNYPLSLLDPATRACPECGRTFDPLDPWTMNTSRPVPNALHHWIGPTRWLLPTMRIVVMVTLLANIPLVGGICASWIVLCTLSAMVGCIYYFRKLIRHAVVVRYALPKALLAVDRMPIAKSRRLFAFAALILFFRIPFFSALFLSIHWLNASGHSEYSVRPHDSVRPSYTMIGLFPIREVRVDYQGVVYHTWVGAMWYTESNDGKHSWKFFNGDDPLQFLPW